MFVGELIQQTDYTLKYTLKSHIIRTLKFILRALSTIQRSFRDEKLPITLYGRDGLTNPFHHLISQSSSSAHHNNISHHGQPNQQPSIDTSINISIYCTPSQQTLMLFIRSTMNFIVLWPNQRPPTPRPERRAIFLFISGLGSGVSEWWGTLPTGQWYPIVVI